MEQRTRNPPTKGRPVKRSHLLLICSGWVSSAAGLAPSIPVSLQRRRSSTSMRRFVLTTPEAIIEQASTTKLLDDLIDESVRTSARRPIMMQFDPRSGWIWKRWKGTVFSETWDACVYRMIYASAVFILCKSFPPVKETLSGFSILWGQLLSVTTFTLTFFVNQSYALWRKCSDCSRSLQGRLHDMDMTLAAHATRVPPTGLNQPSTYTPEARQMLELVSRYVRLFNLLTYASFTRSHRPVLTPRGMRRLVERGLMTPLEREVLINAAIPATQRHNAVLLWIIRAFIEGTDAGHFKGGDGFEQQFIEKAHVCRSAYGSIGDELQGRMPLAYAHIVQVLVDLVLVLYPFMAFSSGMSGFVCVMGTGILTIGYQGLFDLAKQFLDPYDNENYGKGEDPLVVDTLIAETNAGSVRWMYGLAEMPLSPIKVQEGDLAEYLLPLRGFTVDEVKQKQEEKQALQEKRDKEELVRLRKEEHEQFLRNSAEMMIPLQMGNTISPSIVTSDASQSTSLSYVDDVVAIPGAYTISSFQIANIVNDAIVSQNSNATSLQLALIPRGTAPALLCGKASANVVATPLAPPEDVVNGDVGVSLDDVLNMKELLPMVDVKSNERVNESLETPETDISSSMVVDVSSIDNFGEPTVDTTSLSLEPIVGATIDVPDVSDPVCVDEGLSITDYERQVIESLEAEKAELLETQAILNAPPAAEGIEELEKQDDGMSKSMNATVSELSVVDLTTDVDERVADRDPPDYDLSLAESTALAGTGFENPLVDEPLSAADYEKQFQVILQAVNEERLETQAILDAPPAAEVIPVLEKDQNSLPNSLNVTDSDELSVLEMDISPEDSATEFAAETVDLEGIVGVELSPLDAVAEAIKEINGLEQVK